MNILLDTHALLWAITDKDKLSEEATQAFLNEKNKLFLSVASLWEISIKVSLGKLLLVPNWDKVISQEMTVNSIAFLPIAIEHCATLQHLPFHHRDPFDRMIISQAMTEGLTIMSKDKHFSKYSAQCIW